MKISNIFNSAKKCLMLFFAGVLLTTVAQAQMSGSYTIDPANTGAATATMFKNWNSFVKSLYNTSTTVNPRTDGGPIVTGNATVSGPVSVTVVSTNAVNETVTLAFPAVTGVSSTNTITIDGNYQTFNFGTTAYAPFQFTGIDYLTIKNLTLVNASTTPGGFWFNNQSDYNTITGCTVNFTALTTATSTVSYMAFSTSVSSATGYGSVATGTTGQPGSYNTISNNIFYTSNVNSPGPYYAISLNGNSSNYTTVSQNNTFSGNTIKNFYYYAIYQYYTNGNVITNNDISRVNATSGGSATLYGILSYYPYCSSRSSEITNNNIHDMPFTGATTSTSNMASGYMVYVYYPTGNASYKAKTSGNTMTNIIATTSAMYLFYCYYPTDIEINNNTINNFQSTATGSTQYAFYIYYPTRALINSNTVKNVVVNYYIYTFYVYYGSYIDVNYNITDNIVNNYGSGYIYNFYIYYPTGVRCNGNKANAIVSNYYLYNFYLYYGSVGTYTWNEFQDNVITNNSAVSYNYSAYIYYYNGTNNFKVNRNYCVGNKCTGSTGYHYFYLYYFNNYEVNNNVVAGNYANSQYIYIYSGLSGSYTAEVRNNTFQANTSTAPTPGSSYIYCYLYLYYHTVWFTGNIIDLKGSGSQYYRYLYMYLSYSNIANLKEFDYNTYSLNNLFTYPYWYFNGTNYVDWAGFSGSGVNGPNDNGIDPLFVNISTNDWRPGAWGTQNNVPQKTSTAVDVKSTTRNPIKHDRGGLETQTDIELVNTNFTVPSAVCAGYTNGAKTYLILKSNYAYDKASGFKISYTINGGPKTTMAVNKKMAFGDTAKVFFPNDIYLSVAGKTRLAFFIDMPDDYNANDSIIFNTYVTPAPGGGVYTNTADPTRALYQPAKPNDITVLNAPVYYTINQPRKYTNADYKGNGGADNWSATVKATCKWGKVVSGMTMTAPTASTDMKVQFVTSDKSLEDSMLNLYVIVHDETNTCDTVIKRQLLIYPTIIPDFKKPTQACLGEPVLFENLSTVNSGNMEFSWDFGTGVASDNTDAPDPVFVFTKEGTYKVKMTAKTLPYGFVSVDSTIFQVNPIPSVKFLKQNACEGNDLVFTNQTTPSNGTTYAWDFGDNTSSTLTNPSHKYSNKGAYTVTLTSTLNGCVSKSVQRAYQFENPVAGFAKATGSCDNKEFTFSNSSTVGSAELGYFWNFDDGSFSTAREPKHTFDGFGNKNVKLIVTTEFGCKDSVVRVISVKESPKVKFTHGPACSLKPTVFNNQTAAVPSTYANYTWSFSDGSTSSDENPTHAWSTLGSKSATLNISLDNGCSSSTTQNFDVLVEPKAQFNAQDVCAGEPVVFSNKTTYAQGDISYKWDFADNSISTESDPIHSFNAAVTTTYNVTLIASILNGCSDTTTVKVTVNEGPKTCDFAFTPDYGFGFYGMQFQPMDNSGKVGAQSGVTYTWVIQNGGQKSGNIAYHNFTKDGSFSVTMNALIKSTGCECSKTKNVVMNRANAKNLVELGATVFPNPSNGMFNVALTENFGPKAIITITSLTGATIQRNEYANNGMLTINASNLSSGVYMVTVSNGNTSVTEKITIQK